MNRINRKVSVVMAVYNGSDYLQEQLESIRTQKRQPDEVIICDDGSSDGSQKLIETFIKQYQLQATWKLYKNPKNLGYADNFYKGLHLSTGDYIFFSDQDDIWNPDKTAEMVTVMDLHPEIQLLCSDFIPLLSSSDAPTVSKKVLLRMRNDGSLEKVQLNRKNIFIGSLGCLMCLRKTFRDQIQEYWFSGWAHDEYVWKLSQCVDGCYRYHRQLVQRRLHSNNVSMRKYHVLEKRIHFLSLLKESHERTYHFALSQNRKKGELAMLEKNIRSTNLRIQLLKGHWNVLPLTFFYWKYYHSIKSLLMEPYLLIKKN